MCRMKIIVFLLFLSANGTLLFAQLTNDLCSSAIDIQPFLLQTDVLAGPYTNEGATGNDVDILDVTGCWLDHLSGDIDTGTPQVDATVWFRFEGYEGDLSLFVQPCDSNLNFLSQDTQMVLFTGECDSLELVACNEDLNAASNYYWSGITTEVQSGRSYYLAIDGFNYSGFGSPGLPLTTGEFCFSKLQPEVSVTEIYDEALMAFPNPSNGMVTLKTKSPMLEVSIYDVSGACCSAITETNNIADSMIRLPQQSGIYNIRVKTKRGYGTARIIRN